MSRMRNVSCAIVVCLFGTGYALGQDVTIGSFTHMHQKVEGVTGEDEYEMGDELETKWKVKFENNTNQTKAAYAELHIIDGSEFEPAAEARVEVTLSAWEVRFVWITVKLNSASDEFYDYYDEVYGGYLSSTGWVQVDYDSNAYWSML